MAKSSATLDEAAGSAPAGDLSTRVLSLRLPDTTQSRSFANVVAWSLVILLAGLSSFLGWQLWRARQALQGTTPVKSMVPQMVAAKQAREASREVDLADARPRKMSSDLATPAESVNEIVLESKGNLIPRRQVLVSPQVSGRLIELNIEEGRRVTAGEILAKVDTTEYQANYDRALASLNLAKERLLELQHGNRPEEIAQAEAALREAEALLPQRKREYERQLRLQQTQATSVADFDLAESNYRSQLRRVEQLRFAVKLMREGPRQERIRAAAAEVALAEAELAKAQWQLENCSIRAPISGTILRKNAEQGNLVNPIAFNGSFSICEIADLSDLEVDLSIQERDIGRVFVGQQCTVRTDAFPQRIYHGTVSRLMPIADRAKGAIPVRVRVNVPPEEEGQYLKPEMSALVTFRGKRPDS